MSGTQRLANLLELANQGPAMRAALAEEIAELLADWPADCSAELRGACEALLARAARGDDAQARPAVEPQSHILLQAARSGEAVAPYLARALDISESLALEILCDDSGYALVVAAKSLGLTRAAFSSLVLLSCPVGDNHRRLDAFDAVSAAEAGSSLHRWTGRTMQVA